MPTCEVNKLQLCCGNAGRRAGRRILPLHHVEGEDGVGTAGPAQPAGRAPGRNASGIALRHSMEHFLGLLHPQLPARSNHQWDGSQTDFEHEFVSNRGSAVLSAYGPRTLTNGAALTPEESVVSQFPADRFTNALTQSDQYMEV